MKSNVKSSEVFHITSIKSGFRNNIYYDVLDAIKALYELPANKREKFGITCVETYAYFDDSGDFLERETYESWVNVDDYNFLL